uniref:Uncharacterized protein n=2 Tax=Lotharella globosa TaxID=91324 RepID=A0A7S3YSF5_9EUKA
MFDTGHSGGDDKISFEEWTHAMRSNISSIKQDLVTATSASSGFRSQAKAWEKILHWMEPTLKYRRKHTVAMVRDKADTKTSEKHLSMPSPRSAMDDIDVSGCSEHILLLEREEQLHRETHHTIAAAQNLRTWLSRLCSVDNDDIGIHLNKKPKSSDAKQVFLGGSCNPTTWRKDIAIPQLEKAGISYYNPQVKDWTPDLVEIEAHAKAVANCLLFVIDPQTRATSSMLETAEYICSGRVVVLVIQNIEEGCVIEGQSIIGRELKDLNRGRAYIKDVAERHGVPLFTSVQHAIDFIVRRYQETSTKAMMQHISKR